MRFNENEVAQFCNGEATKEGRIYHKSANPNFREGYRERWFKLKGNLLYYFKVNEFGGVSNREPSGVLVIEDCVVKVEDNNTLPFSFSLTFNCEPERKHLLSCQNQKQCDEWVEKLREASYETQRHKLVEMQSKIIELTGNDPLALMSFKSF